MGEVCPVLCEVLGSRFFASAHSVTVVTSTGRQRVRWQQGSPVGAEICTGLPWAELCLPNIHTLNGTESGDRASKNVVRVQ